MSKEKCYECYEAERKVNELTFQITDMKFSRVTAFLLGIIAGVVIAFALMLGF